jgi:hypothetical protein
MTSAPKYLLAVASASLLTAGAWAQANPPGTAVPPNTPGVAVDRAQRAGEQRKNTRPVVPHQQAGGDTLATPEGGAIGTDKAAQNGERRAQTRDARRPGKTPTHQGGTPK